MSHAVVVVASLGVSYEVSIAAMISLFLPVGVVNVLGKFTTEKKISAITSHIGLRTNLSTDGSENGNSFIYGWHAWHG